MPIIAMDNIGTPTWPDPTQSQQPDNPAEGSVAVGIVLPVAAGRTAIRIALAIIQLRDVDQIHRYGTVWQPSL